MARPSPGFRFLPMETTANRQGAFAFVPPQLTPYAAHRCIVLLEPEDDADSAFSTDAPQDSNWGTTYCRLRRASELM